MRKFLIYMLLIIAAYSCTQKSSHRIEVSGHRGANVIAPENTIASADSCIKYGVEYMECDVCISSDSVFYILHDRSLDRTTNGSGLIAEWNSADIDTLDAGVWFGDEFAGMRVPKLEQLLAHAKGRLKLTIDYRTGDLNKLVELIGKYEMLDEVCFTFFDENDTRRLRRILPEFNKLQAYAKTKSDISRIVSDLGANIAVSRIDVIDHEFMAMCRENGLQVLALVLGLEDNTEEINKAIELKVDYIASDRPELLKTQYLNN